MCPRQKKETIVMTHFKDEYDILRLSATPELNHSSFVFPYFFTGYLKSLLALSLMLLEHGIEKFAQMKGRF